MSCSRAGRDSCWRISTHSSGGAQGSSIGFPADLNQTFHFDWSSPRRSTHGRTFRGLPSFFFSFFFGPTAMFLPYTRAAGATKEFIGHFLFVFSSLERTPAPIGGGKLNKRVHS